MQPIATRFQLAAHVAPLVWLLGCGSNTAAPAVKPTNTSLFAPNAVTVATATSAPANTPLTTALTIGRFTLRVPLESKLAVLEAGDMDGQTEAIINFPRGETLAVQMRNRDPGANCDKILDLDEGVYNLAPRSERLAVGEDMGLLAVGAGKHVGIAQLKICKPSVLEGTLLLNVPNRDIEGADRDALVAMGATMTRVPVPKTPIAQCIDREVPDECRRACNDGHADSCVKLGRLTFHGNGGLTKDPAAALELFKRGCKMGSEKGCQSAKPLEP